MPLTISQYNKFEYAVNITKKDPYTSNSFFLIDPQFFIHWQKNYLQKTDHSFCVKSKNEHNYDPELGRFMQEDPMGQGPTPYTYCANNPLTYIDPDGQLFGIDDWIIGAIIGAVITGCGKDLKNPDTWFDIAIGATAGAFGGVFVDTVASEGAFNWMATVANEEGAMAMLGGGAVKWGIDGMKGQNSLAKDSTLSDSSISLEDTSTNPQHKAAYDALSAINPLSVIENREYGGLVYQDIFGKYKATKPIRGTLAGVFPGNPKSWLYPITLRKVTAYYHTHGGNTPGYNNENFSRYPGDIQFSEYYNIDGYLATPGGKFKYYDVIINQVFYLGKINN